MDNGGQNSCSLLVVVVVVLVVRLENKLKIPFEILILVVNGLRKKSLLISFQSSIFNLGKTIG